MKTLLYKFCLLIVFIVCSLVAIAQSDSLTIDSLKKVLLTEKEDTNKVNTLNAIRDILSEKDYEKLAIQNNKNPDAELLQISNQALHLAQKLNFKKGEEKAFKGIADYYVFNPSVYINNVIEAQKISIALNEKENTGWYYVDIGQTYSNIDKDAESLNKLFLGLKIFEELNDTFSEAYCTALIAQTYLEQENYSDGLKYSLLCLKLSKESGNIRFIAAAYNTLGDVYYNLGNYDSALQKHLTAIKIWNDSSSVNQSSYTYIGASSYGTIGNIHEKEGHLVQMKEGKAVAEKIYRVALQNYFVSLK